MAALIQLNEAIHSDDDAKIIAACKLIKHIVDTGPRIDEKGLECLEKLGPWLKTPQNTSKIKSLKALTQSKNDNDEVKKVLQQFTDVLSQTRMPMEDRIFGAVERLRKQMLRPDPATMKLNTAVLQVLDQVLLTRDFKWALDTYKVLVRTDNRPGEEIERDIKDLQKLTLRWLTVEGKSPITSLQAMVESTDFACVKQVIGEFSAGNSPQKSTRELVSSVVSALHRLAQEAAQVSPRMSSETQPPLTLQTQGQGTKRLAPEEADAPPVQRVRRETNSGPKEDATSSDTADDKELSDAMAALLGDPDAQSLLRQLLQDKD